MDCIFCKIIKGQIPSKKLFEDEEVVAFYDVDPKAPIHFLVIPKQHICGAGEITADNAAVVGRIFEVIAKLTKELEISDFRVVTNNGEDAGQTVHHMHFHVLAGETLGDMC
jgi:histidine triad (HIT) family protein